MQAVAETGSLRAHVVLAVALLLACVLLWAAAPAAEGITWMPLWLHNLAETIAIAVAAMVFAAAWNAPAPDRRRAYAILAAGFLGVALLDFGHMLSFGGMPAFVTPSGGGKGIYFWFAARGIGAVALLAMALHAPGDERMAPRARVALLAGMLGLVALVYWLVLYRVDLLPVVFVPGQGLTATKVAIDWGLAVAYALAAGLHLRAWRRQPEHSERLWIATACAVSALSELCFTSYARVTDAFQLVGHAYKVVAYLMLYRAIVVHGVRRPYHLANAEISARARIEAQLRGSEERLRALVESAPYGVVVADAAQRIVLWNTGAEHLFGVPAAAAIGSGLDRYIPPGLREMHHDHVARFGRSERVRASMAGRPVDALRADGSSFPVDVAISSFEMDGQPMYAAIVRDLTEQQRLGAALRESEARARSLLDLFASYEWSSDAEYRFTRMDGKGLEALGIDPARCIGRRYEEVGYAYELLWPSLEDFRRLRDERRPYADVRGRLTLADGTQRYLSLWGSPVFSADGAFAGYNGVTRDITDLVQLEVALEAANRDLEARVARRTEELRRANQELEAFSYSVSHDLRAPLRSINAFARMVIDDEGARLSDDGRRKLAVVESSAQKMGDLVDALLRLSRAGRDALRVAPVNLGALAQRIGERCAAENPRSRFECAATPVADGDPTLLEQLLENLLGNAFKYSARVAAPGVGFGWSEDARAWYVRDNGAGFEPQYAHKLFRAFERLHSPRDFKGTGIGLAIAARIVERHGGRIWAESVPGEGATFWFTLRAS